MIDSFEELFEATVDRDFAPIYRELPTLSEFQPEDVLETDEVITRGTQAYARAKRAKEREPA